MSKSHFRCPTLYCLSLLLVVSLTATTPAVAAEWMCAHGSAGRIHDSAMHDTATLDKMYFVWGIGYQQVPNATNWIIFPVPTYGAKKTRNIAINLKTIVGGDIYVDRVAVWAGETKLVSDIVVNWSGDDLGWQLLDLGSDMIVTSLSVALRTRTGDFGGQLRVHSVCAETK